MVTNANLRKAVSDALTTRGFRRSGRTLIRRVDDEWSFWVDTGPLGSRCDITPFAGIRNDRVEQLFAKLLGVPHDKYAGTVGANVGYLVEGQAKTWAEPSTSDEVVAAIEQALESMQPYLSLERLPAAWDLKGANDPGRRYRQIVIALLQDQRQRVRELLDEARRVFCKVENGVCEQFRGFEARALELLNGADDSPAS